MSGVLPSCFRCFRHSFLTTAKQFPDPASASCSSLLLRPAVWAGQGSQRWKADDRRALAQSMPIKDMGTQGEREVDIDVLSASSDGRENFFPDAETKDKIFDGAKFSELPICHIKVSKNNSILHLTDHLGTKICYRSCGQEGFKNARKGTNIAAQTTAIALATMAKDKGVSTIRIAIQGLGPGRMSSVKGLHMGGLKIVAIADVTPISWNPPRARKARRI